MVAILNPAPAKKLSSHILRRIDIITPNISEAEILSGIEIRGKSGVLKAVQSILKKGPKTVIITMGKKAHFFITQVKHFLLRLRQ